MSQGVWQSKRLYMVFAFSNILYIFYDFIIVTFVLRLIKMTLHLRVSKTKMKNMLQSGLENEQRCF